MDGPFFTIILPIYNSCGKLNITLENIIAQSFVNWELIICDNLSMDNTEVVVKEFLPDSRIHYFKEKDQGIYDAMNKGIKKGKGKWFYFTGAGDYFYSNEILKKIYSQCQNESISIIYGGTNFIPGNHEYKFQASFNSLLTKNISHQAIFYHNSIFKKFGLYNTKYPILADWEFNLRWINKVKDSNVLFIDEIIANQEDNGVSMNMKDSKFETDFNLILSKTWKETPILKKIKLLIEKKRYYPSLKYNF